MSTGAADDITRQKNRAVVTSVAVIALVVYACIFIRLNGVYACGLDPTGYFNCAKLLNEGDPRTEQRVIPGVNLAELDAQTFVPAGLRPLGDKQMGPSFSTGLPLAVVAFSKVAGWQLGPPLVMYIASLLGALLTFRLGREWGLSRYWAAAAALILAINPLYFDDSHVLMSDVPALICATAAVLMAWWSRTREPWALAVGCAVAAGVLVRVTNILVIVPIAVCLGFSWRRWLWLVLGGLPEAIFLCLFNSYTYGHAFESSYGGGVKAEHFSLAFIPATLVHYAYWMPMLMTPLVLFVLGLPWLLRRAPRRALTLIAWIAAFFGFYAVFVGTHRDWASTRYVLPGFPACLVGALWVLQSLLDTPWVAKLLSRMAWIFQISFRPAVRIAVWIAAVAWLVFDLHDNRHVPNLYTRYLGPLLPIFLVLIHGRVKKWLQRDITKNVPILCGVILILLICNFFINWNLHFDTFSTGQHQRDDLAVCQWANKNLPSNSVVYAYHLSGALYYYTPFAIVRWDFVTNDSQQKEIERACAAGSGRPIYALIRDHDVDMMKDTNRYENWIQNWTQFNKVKYYTCWRLNKEPAPSAAVASYLNAVPD